MSTYIFGLKLHMTVIYPNSTAEGKNAYIEITSDDNFPGKNSTELVNILNGETKLKIALINSFKPDIKNGGGILSMEIIGAERL